MEAQSSWHVQQLMNAKVNVTARSEGKQIGFSSFPGFFFWKHTCYLCHHIQFSSHLLLALDDFSTDVYCLLSCVHHSPTTLENAIKTTPLLRNRLSLTFTMEGRSNDIWSASHKILRTTSNQISSTGREQITTQHTVFLG